MRLRKLETVNRCDPWDRVGDERYSVSRSSETASEHYQRVVAISWEALECLRDQWPVGARGRTYRAAYRVCRDVLDG
ncbi:DUF982 domain-containing protein [Sinorhizobium fredii]|uniref:DUF982 domain-containing protein n=1 Tax=Rhizobium fredii TaxID=380 RepID=UPI001FCB9928|nr:DUF982 domain-containing protein [Sinorhizobium fredii]